MGNETQFWKELFLIDKLRNFFLFSKMETIKALNKQFQFNLHNFKLVVEFCVGNNNNNNNNSVVISKAYFC